MIDVFADQAGTRVKYTLPPEFADGAAGTIHRVNGRPGTVAKLYKDKSDCAIYEPKIKTMIDRPPCLPDTIINGKPHVQIAWPTSTLTDSNGKFVGFLMPEVDFGSSKMLENLMFSRERKQFGIQEFFGYRILLARNLAALMAELHNVGHYMIDMKPENLRFYKDEWSMAVVDTDGFSIQGPSERLPADQFSDGYIAPEAKGISPSQLSEEQDRFSLAVIIFRMLNNGVHPFQGTNSTSKVLPSSYQERIFSGLYAYGVKSHPDTGPARSSIHDFFEPDTRLMFDRAFQEPSNRPSAEEWRDHLGALYDGKRLRRCAANPTDHGHFSLGCGHCAQEKIRAAAVLASNAATRPVQHSPSQIPSLRVPVHSPPPLSPNVPKKSSNNLIIGAAMVAALALGWGLLKFVNHGGTLKPPYPIAAFAAPIRERVTSLKLNVRNGPGPTFPSGQRLVQGDFLTAFGMAGSSDGGVWQYVQLQDGSFGYVNSRLVQSVADTAAQPAPVTVPTAAPVTTQVPPPSEAQVAAPVVQAAPPPDDPGRVQQIINSTNFSVDQGIGSGAVPGHSMILRVDASYSNARSGDTVLGTVSQNGEVTSRCDPISLQTAGSFWCRIPIYRPGDYVFALAVNGTQVVTHEYNIHPQAQAEEQAPSTPYLNQPQPRQNQNRYVGGGLAIPTFNAQAQRLMREQFRPRQSTQQVPHP